jgi:hypothetical protein
MADQEASKNPKQDDAVVKAINDIAMTKAGLLFFRWLAYRCFHARSTIVGNPETHEINPLGSVAQAYVQRLFQDIYRVIKPEIRVKIDYPHLNDE